MDNLRVYVLNWNGGNTTAACVDAVLRSAGVRPDLYVIDNASTDGSPASLRERLGGQRVVPLAENRGYAAGMNGALAHLRRDGREHAVLLTQDAMVAPDALARMLNVLRSDPGLAIVGPLVVYRETPHRLIGAGGAIDPRRVRAPLHRTVLQPGPYGVDWVDGCCLLVRLEALETAGGFDEGYFLYFEDTDVCHRVRRRGWSVAVAPDAIVWHEKSAVPAAYYYHYMTRNRYRFWRSNFGIGAARVGLAVAAETAATLGHWGRSLLRPALRGQRGERRLRFVRQARGAISGTAAFLRGETGRMAARGTGGSSSDGGRPPV